MSWGVVVVMGEPVWSARWPLRRSATVTAASANPGLPCCAGNTPTILAFRLSGLCRRDHPAQHGHQNLSRRPSPHVRATRRWPVKCRRGHHGVQTRGAGAADHGIEDERHARLRALSRSVGTADGVPVTGRCRLLVNCAVSRGASWPGQRTSRTLSGVCNSQPDHGSDHHADRRR